uniref:Uncharacterized protein n=1 Tax=Arundo donax TaxID=35708 RepID=A0A0A9BMT8_ARUDO
MHVSIYSYRRARVGTCVAEPSKLNWLKCTSPSSQQVKHLCTLETVQFRSSIGCPRETRIL